MDNYFVDVQADRDFDRLRAKAFWRSIWARIRGQHDELLNFEEVKHKLRLSDERYIGLREIPLDAIVGSVGRTTDFTREFLPKGSVSKSRWKAVDALALGSHGFPPIDVYKVGNAYFVLDGNHRVSVARANGMASIEAYVTEYRTDVPFDKDTQLSDLPYKAGYAYFLRETNLKGSRPKSEDIILTEPWRYTEILEHIHVHYYFIGLDCECPISWYEAVASWYDRVYMPMIQAIRDYDIMAMFGEQTEADLYLWLIKHQGEMQEAYGDWLTPEETAGDFLEKVG